MDLLVAQLLYPINNNFNNTLYDITITFDKYGLSSNEELYIDLTELIHCQQQDNDEIATNDNHAASASDSSDDVVHSTASSSLNADESSSLSQAKTTNNLSTKKSLVGQLNTILLFRLIIVVCFHRFISFYIVRKIRFSVK